MGETHQSKFFALAVGNPHQLPNCPTCSLPSKYDYLDPEKGRHHIPCTSEARVSQPDCVLISQPMNHHLRVLCYPNTLMVVLPCKFLKTLWGQPSPLPQKHHCVNWTGPARLPCRGHYKAENQLPQHPCSWWPYQSLTWCTLVEGTPRKRHTRSWKYVAIWWRATSRNQQLFAYLYSFTKVWRMPTSLNNGLNLKSSVTIVIEVMVIICVDINVNILISGFDSIFLK